MVATYVPGPNGPIVLGRDAPFALIAHTAAAQLNTPVTTIAIDTTGANLLIVIVNQFKTNIGTLTDSKGNVWVGLTSQSDVASTNFSRIFYCSSPLVGTGHTFTLTAGGVIAGGIYVQAWSGAAAVPFDVENGATAASANSIACGSVSPGLSNSLIIAGLCTGGVTGAVSINSGFTISDFVDFNSGVNVGGYAAYFVQGAATPINPTWSWTSAIPSAATIAVFKT